MDQRTGWVVAGALATMVLTGFATAVYDLRADVRELTSQAIEIRARVFALERERLPPPSDWRPGPAY